jgi:hypothetical protein
MTLPEGLPSFDELPVAPDKPPRSAWGLFGDDDQVGTLNLLTPERVAAAARLVRRGQVFALNWEMELPHPPLFFRETLRQTIKRLRPYTHDDVYDNYNPQSSTQWDGLTHYGHRRYGFYNGVTAAEITGQAGTRNGIEHWARRGIAGRGVLIDFARWAEQQGLAFDPGARSEITVEQLQAAAAAQGVRFQTGDILIVRTGWIAWYLALSARARFFLAHKWPVEAGGVRQGDETLRFLWDQHFAAIASDCPSFEAYPPADPDIGPMHETIIGLWGMPIGEMFYLEPLAADCAQDGVYEFFLTSAPLNKLGGVASPPNALAIK